MGPTLLPTPNIYSERVGICTKTSKLQLWIATFSLFPHGASWHLFSLLCQYMSEVQLTDIFVLEQTKHIPDHVHNSLGHPQSILVSCWSICICLVVYFLKGHFLNLNIFPLLCVSADNNSCRIVLGLPSQAGFAMLHLKELCLFFLPTVSHAISVDICLVGLINSCSSREGQGGIPHLGEVILNTEVLAEWWFSPALLCLFAAITLGFDSSSLV